MVIVKTCEDTDDSTNSARECDAPLYLPRHRSQNETWYYNKGKDSDNKDLHPRARALEGKRCPIRIILSTRGLLARFFRVVTLRGESDVVDARWLLQRGLGAMAVSQDLFIVGRLGPELDWLGRRLVTAGSCVIRCAWIGWGGGASPTSSGVPSLGAGSVKYPYMAFRTPFTESRIMPLIPDSGMPLKKWLSAG